MAVATVAPAGLRQIVEAISAGRCLLFLGAGVHAPPPAGSRWTYSDTTRPLLGGQLSSCLVKELADDLDLAKEFPNDVSNLQRSSLHFEINRSRNQLVDLLTKAVQTDKEPSPALRGLAQLDFPLVITTNYDRLLEQAFSRAGKTCRLSVYNKERKVKTVDFRDAKSFADGGRVDQGIVAPDAQNPFVLKIHGDIVDRTSIVVTDEDYIHFVMRTRDPRRYNPVPNTFQVAIETWTTLFIGYSLLDYNLRLLFKTLRWGADPANTPDSYSVDRTPDPLIAQVLGNPPRRLVTFVVLDLWSFVPDLYQCLMGKEMPD